MGNSAIHMAAARGEAEQVEALLRAGHSSEKKADYNCTPMHEAARKGRLDVVEVLHRYGGEVNARNELGLTPLHLASRFGHFEVVERLVELGADVEKKDMEGWTALHEACREGHDDVVSTLLAANCNVNARTNFGSTPLHEVAYHGHTNLLGTMLEAGSDHSIGNNYGHTPLDLAKLEGWRQTTSILTEHERKDRAEKLRQALESDPADVEEVGDFDAEDFAIEMAENNIEFLQEKLLEALKELRDVKVRLVQAEERAERVDKILEKLAPSFMNGGQASGDLIEFETESDAGGLEKPGAGLDRQSHVVQDYEPVAPPAHSINEDGDGDEDGTTMLNVAARPVSLAVRRR